MSWTYRFRDPKPAPYQFDTLKKAIKRKRLGILFEQRVGKTRVAIDGCGVLNAAHGKRRFMILSPKSVVTVWPDAIEQYWNGPTCIVSELGFLPDDGKTVQFMVVNYDQFWRHLKEYTAFKSDVLILDEVHYLKHHTSKRSRAVHKLADKTEYVWGLTGTPGKPENGWFGIMRAIDPSVFGTSFAAFDREHLVSTTGRGYWELLGYRDEAALAAKFAEATVRVLREDAGIVDQFENVNVPVKLEPRAKKLYDQLEKDSYLALPTGEVTAGIVLTKDLRLHQLAGGFLAYDDGTTDQIGHAKLDKCVELVRDLVDQGRSVVVVCRFNAEYETIFERVSSEYSTALINGQTTGAARESIRQRFQKGEIKVLIAQEKTICAGIDLTASHDMIFFSVDFNLDDYLQVRDRVMGRAQKHPVTYWHLVAQGTVDKDVYRALQRGENVVKALVNRHRLTAS